jgi:hypothetical protein
MPAASLTCAEGFGVQLDEVRQADLLNQLERGADAIGVFFFGGQNF